MDNNAKELLLEVGFIFQEEIGFSRTFDFEFAYLKLEDDLELDRVTGAVTISRSQEGILAQGEFSGFTDLECGRCLDGFSQYLETSFSEMFTFPTHADEDTELILPENKKIDLAPVLREFMILDIPINPKCRQDCQGLCPVCGRNRNKHECDHEVESVDPRFEVLKTLLDEE